MFPNNGLAADPQEKEPNPAELSAGIDLDELARKVFELLLQELELENDRTGK